ncbi:MAG: hypothetical protein NT049_03815, partial [Planctomycetota bacterium]|nr:hypothetical protein [Planctomycetota bacterium]
YPSGVVTIAPQLPSGWDRASIKTPDFSLAVKGNQYRIELTRPATLDVRLPVRARKVTAVTVNGHPVEWRLLPAYGRSEICVRVPATKAATVEIVSEEPLPQFAAMPLEITAGDNPRPPVQDAKLFEYDTIPKTAGYHLIDSLVQIGEAYQRRLFKVKVIDPKADAAAAARFFEKPPADARWECLDLSKKFNGDIRTIFQQKYLSPRPDTCSLRLAVDGYSTWQMMLGATHKPPVVDLAGAPALVDGPSRLRTPQGVPFAWAGGDRNIAFTSMWDNWPRQTIVPVGRKAAGIWLLVCGYTNPMQGRIANAELRLAYADGVVEKLELVPPLNFWSMCRFGGVDYDYKRDFFSLPKVPPETVQLGANCRANLLNLRLRPDVTLESVTLETLSQEVIIGLMGASLMNPR